MLNEMWTIHYSAIECTLTAYCAYFHGNVLVGMVVFEHGQYQRDGKWFHPHRDSRHIGFQCQIEMYICLQRKGIEMNFICETGFRSCVCKLLQQSFYNLKICAYQSDQ